jgi:hypothetical protein
MRYLGEVRLRLEGDRTRAQRHILRARTVLGEVYQRDITIGGLQQSWRTVKPEPGLIITVYATTLLVPEILIYAEPVGGPEPPLLGGLVLALRWIPEGILLTPTTLENSEGWGLPRREFDTGERITGLGTEAGAIPQCLLNRYQNNLYHDNPRFMTGEVAEDLLLADTVPADYIPPRTRSGYDEETPATLVTQTYARRGTHFVSYAEPDEEEDDDNENVVDGYVFSEESQEPGVYFAGQLVLRQDQTGEVKTEEWHCHRPEELLFTEETYEFAYRATNLLRESVAEEPVMRPLRGEKDPAEFAAAISASDSVFAHSYFGWQPGTRTAAGRAHLSLGNDLYGWFNNNPGENIQFYSSLPPDVSTPQEVGEWVIAQWEGSPRHYNNIVDARWTESPVYPWHPWPPGGTKGGYVYLAAISPVSFDESWVVNLSAYGYALNEEDPPLNGAFWAQVFSTRETWVPVTSMTREFELGVAGLTAASCAYGRDYYRTQRRFSYNSQLYEIPEGNARPAWFTFAEGDDPFLTCLGCAPFKKEIERADEEEPEIQTWIRGVYWRSSDAQNPYPSNQVDLDNRFGELIVLVWPDGLGDSARLPWREDGAERWEVEFEQRFEVIDGWVPECEAFVQFNKEGTKFLIELERVGAEFHFEGLKTTTRLSGGPGSPGTIDDVKTTFDTGQFNIQRVPFEYTFNMFGNRDLVELEAPDPIRAVVQTGYEDNDEFAFFYEVTVAGEYKIWPHYNAEGDIKWVTLAIDENWRQYERPGSGTNLPLVSSDDIYDPSDPYVHPENRHRGYRRRALRFPSGKEVVYCQQYVLHNFAVDFDPEIPLPGFFVFPGDGRNFYAVLHYLDLETETLIYSEHSMKTYYNYDNLDPLGAVIPRLENRWPPDATTPADPNNNQFSWTRGDSVYRLDAFSGSDRVEEVLAEYPGTVDSPPRYQPMTGEYAAGRRVKIEFAYDLYPAGHTPYTFYAIVFATGAPGQLPQGPGYYAYNTQMMFPGLGFSDVSTASAPGTNDAVDDFFSMLPIDDFDVTVSTRNSGAGENHPTILRFRNGERYRGQAGSGAYYNIAPMFSNEGEVRAKFVYYDDRWVARLEIRHVNRHGLRAPDYSTQPRAAQNLYFASDFNTTMPAGAEEKEGYFLSLAGQFAQETATFGEEKTAVHLKANFDLDEATGISDVYDIEPFGRV